MSRCIEEVKKSNDSTVIKRFQKVKADFIDNDGNGINDFLEDEDGDGFNNVEDYDDNSDGYLDNDIDSDGDGVEDCRVK